MVRQDGQRDWMMMSLVLWLCSLFVIGLLIVPAFGPIVGSGTALALLAGVAVACYLICLPPRLPGGRA